MTEAIGWMSSFVLVITIAKQVYKQWSEEKSEGVSTWLFVGQIAASVGFVVYSVLVSNWIFIFTNFLTVLNGIAGLIMTIYLKKNAKRAKQKWARDEKIAPKNLKILSHLYLITTELDNNFVCN